MGGCLIEKSSPLCMGLPLKKHFAYLKFDGMLMLPSDGVFLLFKTVPSFFDD